MPELEKHACVDCVYCYEYSSLSLRTFYDRHKCTNETHIDKWWHRVRGWQEPLKSCEELRTFDRCFFFERKQDATE